MISFDGTTNLEVTLLWYQINKNKNLSDCLDPWEMLLLKIGESIKKNSITKMLNVQFIIKSSFTIRQVRVPISINFFLAACLHPYSRWWKYHKNYLHERHSTAMTRMCWSGVKHKKMEIINEIHTEWVAWQKIHFKGHCHDHHLTIYKRCPMQKPLTVEKIYRIGVIIHLLMCFLSYLFY